MSDTNPAEAHPPRTRWYLEIFDGGQWMLCSRFFSDRAEAVGSLEIREARAPEWSDGAPVRRRLVRETTTHAVEEA